MEGLTWRALVAPEYLMTFAEGFLLMFLPAIGFGSAIEGAGAIDVRAWPSAMTLLGGGGLGLLNGIRALRNLRAAPPTLHPIGGTDAPKT